LGLRIIAPTARIIPRIIWGENRAQVRSEPVMCTATDLVLVPSR
jgi:hypothetical protein